jgi:hypothetical protein
MLAAAAGSAVDLGLAMLPTMPACARSTCGRSAASTTALNGTTKPIGSDAMNHWKLAGPQVAIAGDARNVEWHAEFVTSWADPSSDGSPG